MAVTVTEIPSYENYGRCVRIANEAAEALVTVDVGPRVIKFARTGGQNIMFNDLPREAVSEGPDFDRYFYPGAKFYNYGGHRFWLSPESSPETYYPDNTPVSYEILENGAVFTPAPQKENGVALQIEIRMDDTAPSLDITHRATNISDAPKTFAPWALTVLGQGGTEIIPLNTRDTGLLANRYVSIWPYADLRDDRFYFGHRYATLRQDPKATVAFKIGFDNFAGRGYYAIGDTVFIKTYHPNHPDGVYPDNGMSFETYTAALFLELETLGELKSVAPGELAEHKENWRLAPNPGSFDPRDDDSIAAFLDKLD